MTTVSFSVSTSVREIQAQRFPLVPGDHPTDIAVTAGAATQALAPTGLDWCWRFTEQSPAGGSSRFCALPDSVSTLDYDDLVDVDPATLAPAVEPPTAAWTASLDAETAARGAADLAFVTPAEIANESLSLTGSTVCLMGDSITDGSGSTNAAIDSYRAYLAKALGSARVATVTNGGVAGNTAAQLLARVPALLAAAPSVCVVMIGANASVDLANFKADYVAILDLILAARLPVVVCLLPPRGAGQSAAEIQRTNEYNLYIRWLARQRGIPVADTFAPLVDPATGTTATLNDADGVHPLPAGHLLIAQAVAAQLDPLIAPEVSAATAPGAPGLISNPLMAGGGPTTAPTSWSLGALSGGGSQVTGTVAAVPGDGLTAGSWMKIAATSAAGANCTATRQIALIPAPSPGDRIMITARVKADAGSESAYKLVWADTLSAISNVMESAGIAIPGRICRTYTVGTVASARILCSVTTPLGINTRTAYFGEIQVWNLTTMGMLEVDAV